ncbi:MAG: Tad domain-containing protein [Candidatus Riflebacteria bacterium]|nr:Tad domain-containing protein [Candidatus Riflebacteria bacterium]
MHYPRLINRTHSRQGSILFMVVGIAILMISVIALVTDVGFLYYSHAKLQTAVNAAWKAGYDRMMYLQKSDMKLSSEDMELVKAHVLEMMKVNGYTDAQLTNLEISFPNSNSLKVSSKQPIGMFFAQIMNIKAVNVAASRENLDGGVGMIPLGIPHGVTKDFSKKMYSCSVFTGEQEFKPDIEYILKLGSGGGNTVVPPDNEDLKMILVPMDSNSQTETGYLKAYGGAFWCLRIGDGSDLGFVPVYWLLGYRGGSFLLPYHDDVVKKLNALKVNWDLVEGSENIQAIFDQVNPNILELYDRPRIAVYSSQSGTDPVEDVLRAANIPYGEYSLPGGWQRSETYSAASNDHIYDNEILNGVLDNYHWVHLHHEDFTGFNGGCGNYLDSCKDFFDDNHIGTKAAAQERMCSYCSSQYALTNVTSSYYDKKLKKWVETTSLEWQWPGTYDRSSCLHTNMRCAERKGINGVFWRNDSGVTMCGDTNYPQCRDYNRLINIADANGYTSDANSEPKPQTAVSTGNNGPGMSNNQDGWFNRANKVQKMKFDVARTISNHVEVGGFLFAQCFAPETLDIALWQAEIHDGASALEAFSACFAFTDYGYRRFPIKYSSSYYSTINALIDPGTAVPFNLLSPLDPRCQNHGSWPDTGTGHTSVFNHSCIKEDCTVLGNRKNYSTQAKYLKGKRGKGEFSFLGGHWHNNVESKRLVLNNILLGSLVDKQVVGDVEPPEVTGKNKNNYGPLDPDNSLSGGANDYRDRFKFGVNLPIGVNDRLITEPGNMSGPTDQAVDFRTNGDGTYPPNRLVIVPITDVGPEIGVNNPANAGIDTIYDLQGQDHPNGAYRPEDYAFGSSVRVIGFALFKILDPEEYSRDEKDGLTYESGDAGDLGPYQPGQVRGQFIKYIVKPSEAQPLLY